MKKLFIVTLITGTVFACSRKTTPTSEIIISNHETKDEKKEVAASNATTTEAPTGQTIYTTRCGRCHGLKTVENYTAQQWENILKSMVPKAGLDEMQAKQVSAYVMERAKK